MKKLFLLTVLVMLFSTFYCLGSDTTFAESLYLGHVCENSKNISGAVKYFKMAMNKNPERLEPYLFLGRVLVKDKKYDEAIGIYSVALDLSPKSEIVLLAQGNCYWDMSQFDKAKLYFESALNDGSKSFDSANKAGSCSFMLGEYEEAKKFFSEAFRMGPRSPEMLMNFGCSCFKLNEFSISEKIFSDVLRRSPESVTPNFYIATLMLKRGELKTGFPLYNKYRWSFCGATPPDFGKPDLIGHHDLEGKKVLIYTEQGIGDVFQFIRYAPMLKAKGAKVFLLNKKCLSKYMAKFPYVDGIFYPGDRLPEFDYSISLMDLPDYFGSDIDTIPSKMPYLYADEKLVSNWGKKLSKDKNFKIGVCLRGRTKVQVTPKFSRQNDKSLPDDILPYLNKAFGEVKNISVYSLEPNFKYGDVMEIHEFDESFDKDNGAFMDTAALMKTLDLVITVDTSIAHLAGGLNVPVWILLPFHPDWRWFLDRNDSPWYPTAKLFQQPKPGDWKSVIDNIKNNLKQIV